MALPNGHRGGVASPVTTANLRLRYVKMGLNYAKAGRRGQVIHRLGIMDPNPRVANGTVPRSEEIGLGER